MRSLNPLSDAPPAAVAPRQDSPSIPCWLSIPACADSERVYLSHSGTIRRSHASREVYALAGDSRALCWVFDGGLCARGARSGGPTDQRANRASGGRPVTSSSAYRGLFAGAAAGAGAGYIAGRHDGWKSDWRAVGLGTGIGALAGAGVGVSLGFADQSGAPGGRFVARDLAAGALLGALLGAISGGISAAVKNDAEHVLFGASIGVIAGAGLGIVTGIIEGQAKKRRQAVSTTTTTSLRLEPTLAWMKTRAARPPSCRASVVTSERSARGSMDFAQRAATPAVARGS